MRNSHTRFLTPLLVLLPALLLGLVTECRAGEIHKINQLSDFSATTPERFYRFEPNYLWLKPGDTLRFLNSLGNHTVKTVQGIWPEGVEKVDIAHQQQYDIVLKHPGVYGFKCKVHSRHSMFALVMVGDVKPDLEQWRDADLNGVAERAFKGLFERLENDLKKHGAGR